MWDYCVQPKLRWITTHVLFIDIYPSNFLTFLQYTRNVPGAFWIYIKKHNLLRGEWNPAQNCTAVALLPVSGENQSVNTDKYPHYPQYPHLLLSPRFSGCPHLRPRPAGNHLVRGVAPLLPRKSARRLPRPLPCLGRDPMAPATRSDLCHSSWFRVDRVSMESVFVEDFSVASAGWSYNHKTKDKKNKKSLLGSQIYLWRKLCFDHEYISQ